MGLCDVLRTMLLVQNEVHRTQHVQERVVERLAMVATVSFPRELSQYYNKIVTADGFMRQLAEG